MDNKELLEKLFDEKKLRIMQFFFNNPDEEFYLREIAKRTKLPVATVFRLVHTLTDLKIISENKIKKFKLYRLRTNKNTEFLQEMISFKRSALQDFVERMQQIPEVGAAILHGSEEKNKASVLLIGTNIPSDPIKRAVLDIKEAYDFTIMHLTLDGEQYDNMSRMGLYPGKKTILFQK